MNPPAEEPPAAKADETAAEEPVADAGGEPAAEGSIPPEKNEEAAPESADAPAPEASEQNEAESKEAELPPIDPAVSNEQVSLATSNVSKSTDVERFFQIHDAIALSCTR